MKKFCISFLCLAIIFLSSACFLGCNIKTENNKEYLRIHIRANSNEDIDQQVKYVIKNSIVEFLTPYLSTVHNKEYAVNILKDLLENIKNISDNLLRERGFNYTSKVMLKSEAFPLRVYDNLTLEAGIYDALIVELGNGSGDNWWCVVYPPLCFVEGDGNYVYKSKLLEIIEDFLTNKEE